MDLLPLTELEAVNAMLAGIGEAPVNSLPNFGVSEAFIAASTLHNTSRALQQRGWDFNCEADYPLALDTAGAIQLPQNTLKVDVTSSTDAIVQRGSRLYNKTTHSYVFTDSVKAEITFFLAFEEIPQSARTYITVKAARDFAKKVLASDTLASLTEQDEVEARMAFLEAEADTGDYSIFNSYSVAKVLNRSGR
jgi:hypothetical protein